MVSGNGETHFDLGDYVEGICVSRIGEVDFDECIGNSIAITCCARKCVLEIGCWISNFGVTTEHDETCNRDAEKDG